MSIKRLDPGSRMSRAVIHNSVVYTAGHVDNSVSDVAG
jgi:enamine deaminase RidA (YjgF/YER057c/UK114 family)